MAAQTARDPRRMWQEMVACLIVEMQKHGLLQSQAEVDEFIRLAQEEYAFPSTEE